ncbi:hypothetical protein KDK95_28335 [Actinospica sp. MGRD01-02]|uniref:Uncharacterized protein n=1 Tax=Actinospica acidithermotolerans TaxID=2828514 RepID=A0A941EJI1_9ACTN|nr:hypothetical protein [Actinospica acidithermotolerans]MBR7830244.1 hypothetical protein [Actinospica acidithermotolerans]
MKHVRRYEPDLDLEAVKLRLNAVTQRRVRDREAVADLRVEVTSLLAEIRRLVRIEREHRHEFADLLVAARDALAAADAGDKFALLGLRLEVRRHREITAEELDEWRDWSDLLEPRRKTTEHADPD